MSQKKQSITAVDVAAHVILIVISFLILYPLVHVVAVSLSGDSAIMSNAVTIIPKDFTLKSYTYFLENSKVLRAYWNSILYTVVGVLCNVAMTVLMAYPLSKNKLIGRGFLMKFVVFTMYFTGGTIPLYLLVSQLKLTDTMWSLIVPQAIWTMQLIIMISFFRSIPESLYEAAYLDGASEFTIFAKVALPLSKASIASISLFYFMGHWNSYFYPMLYLQDKDKFPLQVVLRSMLMESSESLTGVMMEGATVTPTGVRNAVIVLAMIPVLVIYPFMQRFFVKGVMIGSVKE